MSRGDILHRLRSLFNSFQRRCRDFPKRRRQRVLCRYAFTLCPCHLEDSTFSFKGQHSNHYLMFCSMFKCQRALRVIKYFMNGKAHKVEVIMFMAMTRCKQDLENRKSNFIYAPNSASSLYLKHVCLRRHFRDFHLLRKLIAAIKVQLVSSPCDKLC